jgi:hypothetical protein
MPRGGYQKPKNPAPVSGPGKFSRRTDGKVPSPDIDTERGLQYGDRQMLEEAARISPVAGAQGAGRAAAPRRPAGSAPTRGRIPPWLLGTPDPRPEEPTTAGLDLGPGPGSEALDAATPTEDIRVVMARFWAERYGNADARAWLAQHRMEQAASTSVPSLADPEVAPGLEETALVPE